MAYMNPDGTYQSYVGAPPVTVIAPATGSTYTVPFGTRRIYVNTALIAALTVVVPKLPEAGMEIVLNSKTGITAVTWKDSSGTTLSGLPTASAANVPLAIAALSLTPGGYADLGALELGSPMVAFAVTNMGGEMPRQNDRLLADNLAAETRNVDLFAGDLRGWRYLVPVKDLTGAPGVDRGLALAYRLPPPAGVVGEDAWLVLPSQYASVVRSPLANDTLHRIYFTIPGQGAFWNTYAGILGGTPPYNLGFVPPDPSHVLTVAASGGTTGVPAVERVYLYTLLDINGLESSPSPPSAVVAGQSDGTWAVSGLPGTPGTPPPPPPPSGKHYPPPDRVVLYRTITGTNTGAAYYRVGVFSFAEMLANPGHYAPYIDTTKDIEITGALQLATAAWASPPDDLDGLLGMPGGFLVGFSGNTLHFSEVDRPHAWPAAYDLSVQYDIVGMALWNQSLVVLTQGFPSTGSGTTPQTFTLSQVQTAEPCIARGSIVADLQGVLYASQNGLVQLSYSGITNATLSSIARPEWVTLFGAKEIYACRHRNQYLGLRQDTHEAFLLDASEQRLSVVWLDALHAVRAVWNDFYNGDTYALAGNIVYRWDDPGAHAMAYRWRSKIFNLIKPINFAAAQVSLDPTVADPAPPLPIIADVLPSTVLPAGVRCLFRLWANGNLVYEQPIRQGPEAVFRLPSGYKAHQFEFEITADVPVYKIKLATSMIELNTV